MDFFISGGEKGELDLQLPSTPGLLSIYNVPTQQIVERNILSGNRARVINVN